MNKALHKKIYAEAIAIGDSLLDTSIRDDSGLYWKTLTLDDDINIVEVITENMYNGVSGIAVYLLDLYRVSGEKKYMTGAVLAMNWVFNSCKNKQAFHYGYYTGRISICIAAIRFYQYTKDKNYLRMALEAIKDIKDFNPEHTVDDLIGGNGGTILGLLHLHAYTKEKWLLNEINKYAGFLLDRMNIGKKGIYWDRTIDYVSGLCGFSHGTAGLGFIFLELGSYLQNKAFFWVATKAFEYELQYFNKNLGNWVDLRRHKTTQNLMEQQKKAFLNKDVDYFTKDRFMNAWCHGAAGIGLSRLRAYELFNDAKYLKQVKIAIKTTVNTDLQELSYNNLMIYCHGNCGNADLFIESYLRLGNKKYMDYAELIAEQALKQKNEIGYYKSDNRITDNTVYEDKSLFTGIAGIGHYYLRILEPKQISSVLMPVLNDTINNKKDILKYHYLNISKNEIKLIAYRKVYPKTTLMLENISGNSVKKISNLEGSASIVQNFRKFFADESKGISGKYKEMIKDIYNLENQVNNVDYSISSCALLDIKQILENEKAKSITELDENEFLNFSLKLNDTVFFSKTKWDWSSQDISKNLKKPSDEYFVILKQHPKKTVVDYISPLVYSIIAAFKNGNSVRNTVEEVTNTFEVTDENEKKQLGTIILSQIKELVSSQYLISN